MFHFLSAELGVEASGNAAEIVKEARALLGTTKEKPEVPVVDAARPR